MSKYVGCTLDETTHQKFKIKLAVTNSKAQDVIEELVKNYVSEK